MKASRYVKAFEVEVRYMKVRVVLTGLLTWKTGYCSYRILNGSELKVSGSSPRGGHCVVSLATREFELSSCRAGGGS